MVATVGWSRPGAGGRRALGSCEARRECNGIAPASPNETSPWLVRQNLGQGVATRQPDSFIYLDSTEHGRVIGPEPPECGPLEIQISVEVKATNHLSKVNQIRRLPLWRFHQKPLPRRRTPVLAERLGRYLQCLAAAPQGLGVLLLLAMSVGHGREDGRVFRLVPAGGSWEEGPGFV